MPSFPPPVSPAQAETPAAFLSQYPTGTVGCVSMTTLTMASRTFSWCAQVATAGTGPDATSTPSGEYAFSARDNVELPGPSTWSTVLRSPNSIFQSQSSTSSESPSPSPCGNRADVGDFTFNVSNGDHATKAFGTTTNNISSSMTFHLLDRVRTPMLGRCPSSVHTTGSTSLQDSLFSLHLPRHMTHLLET